MRGVYPLCAMMSHDCTCNTVHTILDDNTMLVIAATNISKGQQVTGRLIAIIIYILSIDYGGSMLDRSNFGHDLVLTFAKYVIYNLILV